MVHLMNISKNEQEFQIHGIAFIHLVFMSSYIKPEKRCVIIEDHNNCLNIL